jgi:hypothetical protein
LEHRANDQVRILVLSIAMMIAVSVIVGVPTGWLPYRDDFDEEPEVLL